MLTLRYSIFSRACIVGMFGAIVAVFIAYKLVVLAINQSPFSEEVLVVIHRYICRVCSRTFLFSFSGVLTYIISVYLTPKLCFTFNISTLYRQTNTFTFSDFPQHQLKVFNKILINSGLWRTSIN